MQCCESIVGAPTTSVPLGRRVVVRSAASAMANCSIIGPQLSR